MPGEVSRRSVPRRSGRLVLVLAALAMAAVAAVAAVGLAPAASADVYISPTEAVQGSATRITFHVHNHRSGVYTTELRVDLPADAPVAEVFPMTVPDWAPEILFRPADRPLPGIHGSGLTEATSSVIWTRAAQAPPAPATEELQLEMGPLPAVPDYVFSITQTSSDGAVQRWQGRSGSSGTGPVRGTVLTLLPPNSDAAVGESGASSAGGHDHGNVAGVTQVSAPVAPASADQVTDSSVSLRRAAGVLLLGVVLGLLVGVGRRTGRDLLSDKADGDGTDDDKAQDDAEDDQAEDDAEPSVAAGERWHS